jgi:hypothetical protein
MLDAQNRHDVVECGCLPDWQAHECVVAWMCAVKAWSETEYANTSTCTAADGIRWEQPKTPAQTLALQHSHLRAQSPQGVEGTVDEEPGQEHAANHS